jgi:hypothetical protein
MPETKDKELELVDLSLLLLKNKAKIVCITLLGGLLGFIIAMALPEKYNVSAIVKLGQLVDEKNCPFLVELPENAEARFLEYGKMIENELLAAAGKDRGLNPLVLQKDGDITIDIVTSDTDLAISFMNRLLKAVQREHGRKIEDWQNDRKAMIGQFEEDGRLIQAFLSKRTTEKKRLAEDLANQESLVGIEKDFVLKRIDAYHNEAIDIKNYLKQIENQHKNKSHDLKVVLEENERVSKKNTGQRDRLSDMENRLNLIYIDELRYRVDISIPRVQNELLRRYFEVKSEIAVLKNRILSLDLQRKELADITQKKLIDFDKRVETESSRLDHLSQKRGELEKGLHSVSNTSYRFEPSVSQKPVSPNVRKLFLLGLMAGFLSSMVIVMLVEFRRSQKGHP